MRSDRRYVFDTNTLVSAALFRGGTPGEAFRYALNTGVVLLSEATFEEIDEVIAREKFDDYLTPEERGAFIEALVDRSQFVNPTEDVRACRDPDDNKFLELAVSENATCIVSGDADLLELNPFRGILIMRPADFLEESKQDE
ncbi:putative toxin-antitoxin system toxin component, PIN family [Salisaeta longa]|uniref:putative toxin-antitoxin system toxin component, PIN family n=1 Tax=Salisaeta longa TaxID=503170 RepID=UPI0003B3D385|nr:putative toxin-antitoxin system toxin component, PIN family [Salisaeta longa]